MAGSVLVKADSVSPEIIDMLRKTEEVGVSGLADRLSMPTSTIHDHLRTLEQEEYLVKENGTYCVGTRFLGIGDHARSRLSVR